MGYVYILTNPSFVDDWVKIGKTGRDDVYARVKELDNTAVPLPFELYATIKTNKYNELESVAHSVLEDNRIRSNREFFNVSPEEAFQTLKNLSMLIDDAEVVGPDDLAEDSSTEDSVNNKCKYHIEGEDTFYLTSRNDKYNATMKVVDGNKYVVIEGSEINLYEYKSISNHSNNSNYLHKLRETNKADVVKNTVVNDITFSSPSGAGVFVTAMAVSGKFCWKNKDERCLNDFVVYEK